MTHSRPGAIALLSGGLDSTVALALALGTHDVRLVLFLDYGQRARDSERGSVLGVVNYYGLPFREIDISWLEDLSPHGMRVGKAVDGDDVQLRAMDDVWIPNRNGVFLNVAAAFAEKYSCEAVITGFNREEAAEFPDNSGDYVSRVNAGLEFSTRNQVRVQSPTLDLTKREILLKGIEVGAPLSVIWSCYRNGEKMCGACASCERLRVALDALPQADRPVIEFEARI